MRKTIILILLSAVFLLAACAAESSVSGSSGSAAYAAYEAENPAVHGADPGTPGEEAAAQNASDSASETGNAAEAESTADTAPAGREGEAAADTGSYSRYASDASEQAKPGVLTAGRQNDLDNWDSFVSVLNRQDWRHFQNSWGLYPASRISASASVGKKPLSGVRITGYDRAGTVLWRSVTDNRGETDVFPSFFDGQSQCAYVEAEYGDSNNASSSQRIDVQRAGGVHFDFPDASANTEVSALDLMLVMDTTGSMSDELEYLKTELTDVVNRVQKAHDGLQIRTSVNFYRDEEDEYVTRNFDFTSNPGESYRLMEEQRADGGGDYPEAMDKALSEAVKNHDWEAPVKLMFLVLDAPPHKIGDNYVLKNAVTHAAAEGIRIIPIASSGVDEETEFLLRTIAASTGGQYVFLTDDSEVGNEHKEPTVSDYESMYLNDLMVDVIDEYLKAYPVVRG